MASHLDPKGKNSGRSLQITVYNPIHPFCGNKRNKENYGTVEYYNRTIGHKKISDYLVNILMTNVLYYKL
mgnify:CR=1 FL=1